MKEKFKSHYGAYPAVLADVWNNLCDDQHPNIQTISRKEQNVKGFARFLAANYFLWTYPKNTDQLASRFQVCEKYARGRELWKWVERIASLKAIKIVWDDRLDNQEWEMFAITVDGTDFKMNEPRDRPVPQDKRVCSKKMNHAAVKYEVGMSVFRPKCVWISKQYDGATHDITMYRTSGLKEKLVEGKLVIADLGYRSSRPDEKDVFSLPSNYDSKQLYNFKSRARLRHEGFNSMLKKYNILFDEFRHGKKKQEIACTAVAVLSQCKIDHGASLYDV